MREPAVSEVVGTIALIAVVVAGMIIVNVVILSQPHAGRVPSLEAIITNTSKVITITHQGGDPLQPGEYQILVDGVDQTGNFTNSGGAGPFSAGETLTWTDPDMPLRVTVVYTGLGTGGVQILSTRFPFGVVLPPYTNTSTPTPVVPTTLPAVPQTTPTPAPANPAWYSCSWQYRKNITFVRSKVSGSTSLTDFPVLINVTDRELVGNTTSNGYDFLFTNGDGFTQIPYERESYNPATGALIAWVKVSGLSATMVPNKSIYMYYGYPTIPIDNQYPTGVWDSYYKGVWHLNNSLADSTSNHNNGTEHGTHVAQNFAGQVSYGWSFDGSSNYITTPSTDLKSATAFTITLWFKSDNTGFAHHLLWEGQSTGDGWGSPSSPYIQEMHVSMGATLSSDLNDQLSVFFGDRTNYDKTLNVSRQFTDTSHWQYVAVNGTNIGSGSGILSLYQNGTLIGYDTTVDTARTKTDNWDTALQFGKPGTNTRYFDGVLDEIRIATTARTKDWIATEYNNTYSPSSFYIVNASEQRNPAWTC
jgi:hypothetical protein